MKISTICAVVLAAGRSRRMGSRKLLLPFAGQTVIGHIVDQVLAAGIERIIVVAGADRVAVAGALAGRKITHVENPDHDGDMLSSIRCGLRALPQPCSGALILLGDQPGISAELVSSVVQKFGSSDCGIVTPVYDGKRGHPIVISHIYFSEVLANFNGIGLQGLMAAHPNDVEEVATNQSTILDDIDFPADYQRALAKHAVDRGIK